MTNSTAEIVNMEDARARRRGQGLHEAEFQHVGVQLEAGREALNLTIREAAAKTHISERHLTAIEALDKESLPARPYAIGFVKTYAEFLDLDVNAIVARFKEDAGYEPVAQVEAEKFEAAETAAENDKRDMSLAAILIVIAFMIWCTWQITRPHEVTQLGAAAGSEPVASIAPAPAAPEDVVAARILDRVEPVYPIRCAVNAEPMETVVVMFNITAAGRISGERVAAASNGCFTDAALNAMRRWRFEPQKIDGEAQPAYDQRVSFTFNRP